MASARVRPITADFEAQYAAEPRYQSLGFDKMANQGTYAHLAGRQGLAGWQY